MCTYVWCCWHQKKKKKKKNRQTAGVSISQARWTSLVCSQAMDPCVALSLIVQAALLNCTKLTDSRMQMLHAGFTLLFGVPACGFNSFSIFMRTCLLLEFRKKNNAKNIQNNSKNNNIFASVATQCCTHVCQYRCWVLSAY